jgi:tetratricopeptide (TPR) repeat protein
MKKVRALFLLLPGLFLSSCFYVSLPESSNPAIKLEEANRFMARAQPLPAERLITEAMRTYEKENNPEGLGNAYRDFAVFLRSSAVAQREQIYRDAGFLDSSITYDNRYEKSAAYLEMALAQYNEAADRYQNQARFDRLSALYYTLASAYLLQNKNTMACSAYDQSRAAYAESVVRNPSARPDIPKGYASFHEAVIAAKNQAGCP